MCVCGCVFVRVCVFPGRPPPTDDSYRFSLQAAGPPRPLSPPCGRTHARLLHSHADDVSRLCTAACTPACPHACRVRPVPRLSACLPQELDYKAELSEWLSFAAQEAPGAGAVTIEYRRHCTKADGSSAAPLCPLFSLILPSRLLVRLPPLFPSVSPFRWLTAPNAASKGACARLSVCACLCVCPWLSFCLGYSCLECSSLRHNTRSPLALLLPSPIALLSHTACRRFRPL